MRLPDHPERIAILKPSALGDIVHALPFLTALRGRFPDASIQWIINKSYESLLAGHGDLTGTIPFDRGRFRGDRIAAIRYAVRFASALRRQRFDLVVDLQGLFRTGIMALATGARVRVGFDSAREGSRHAYTHRVSLPGEASMHAVDRYLAVAKFLGANIDAVRFSVPLQSGELLQARQMLKELPRPWMMVAPGARWTTKRWPPEAFGKLLSRGVTTFGGSVVFLGGPEDQNLCEEIRSRFPSNSLNLAGKTSLPQLSALLSLADVMIANDTGPLHLAAALGRPCVAPFTCTKIVRHGPYGAFEGAVSTTIPCAGSYLKKCPNSFQCMTELTADALWPPLQEVLERCRTSA